MARAGGTGSLWKMAHTLLWMWFFGIVTLVAIDVSDSPIPLCIRID